MPGLQLFKVSKIIPSPARLRLNILLTLDDNEIGHDHSFKSSTHSEVEY